MVTLIAWDWKVEPSSPETVSEESVLIDDSITAGELTAFDLPFSIVKEEHELSELDSSENKAEVFSKLLEEIEDFSQIDEFIKDGESFLICLYCLV